MNDSTETNETDDAEGHAVRHIITPANDPGENTDDAEGHLLKKDIGKKAPAKKAPARRGGQLPHDV